MSDKLYAVHLSEYDIDELKLALSVAEFEGQVSKDDMLRLTRKLDDVVINNILLGWGGHE